jgi:hypothetical protein
MVSLMIFAIPVTAYYMVRLMNHVKALGQQRRHLEQLAQRREAYVQDIENENISRYNQLNDDDRRPNRK